MFFFLSKSFLLEGTGKSCRWNGYRGIPVHLLLGPVIGPASGLEAINNLQRGEDPHDPSPREGLLRAEDC
jgi:hypothetical protein